jgi:hypothetical protein
MLTPEAWRNSQKGERSKVSPKIDRDKTAWGLSITKNLTFSCIGQISGKGEIFLMFWLELVARSPLPLF